MKSAAMLIFAFCFLAPTPTWSQEEAIPVHASESAVDHWRDLSLGIFIHWGPWSQTGVGSIWKIAQETDLVKRKAFFDLPRTFNPTRFDADEWAAMAKRAGAKYVVFTTKHHDGFCNFDTDST